MPRLRPAPLAALLLCLALSFPVAASATTYPGPVPPPVRIEDSGITPVGSDSYNGAPLTWENASSTGRRVVEDAFELYDSRVLRPGESYTFSPRFAGAYPFTVTSPDESVPEFHGSVRFHPRLEADDRGRNPHVTWLFTGTIPAGFAFEVQKGFSDHGKITWWWWSYGTRKAGADMPTRACDGTGGGHLMRVRLRGPDGTLSRWARSPVWSCPVA